MNWITPAAAGPTLISSGFYSGVTGSVSNALWNSALHFITVSPKFIPQALLRAAIWQVQLSSNTIYFTIKWHDDTTDTPAAQFYYQVWKP